MAAILQGGLSEAFWSCERSVTPWHSHSAKSPPASRPQRASWTTRYRSDESVSCCLFHTIQKAASGGEARFVRVWTGSQREAPVGTTGIMPLTQRCWKRHAGRPELGR